jgi:hypothetical protein
VSWRYVWPLFSEGALLLLLTALIVKVWRQRSRLAWLQLICISAVVLQLAAQRFIIFPAITRCLEASPDSPFPGWLNAWNVTMAILMLAATFGFCGGYFFDALRSGLRTGEGCGRKRIVLAVLVLAGLAVLSVLAVVAPFVRVVTLISVSRLLAIALWGTFATGTLIIVRSGRGWPPRLQLAGTATLFLWAVFFLGSAHLVLLPGPTPFQDSLGWVYSFISTTSLLHASGLWMFAVGCLAAAVKRPAVEPAQASGTPEIREGLPDPGLLRRAITPLAVAGLLVAVFAFLEFWGIRGGRLPSARQRTVNVLRLLGSTLYSSHSLNNRYPWAGPEEVRAETAIESKQVYAEMRGRSAAPLLRFGTLWPCQPPSWAVADGCFVDAWGRPLQFRVDPETLEAVVWSCGPDGVDDTNDGVSPNPECLPKAYYLFGTGKKSDDIVERFKGWRRAKRVAPGRIVGFPPPSLPRLKGDAEARRRFLADLANRPAAGAMKASIDDWTWRTAYDASLARDYESAAGYAQALVDREPDWWVPHVGLSIMLGKAGRLAEAESEARTAVDLQKHAYWYPNIVLACWEHKLGKRSEALARMSGVRMPEDKKDHRPYYGNLAAFAAITGDEPQIESAMKKAIELDGSEDSLAFFRRDVLFDPYRAKLWFIRLVGETLESR